MKGVTLAVLTVVLSLAVGCSGTNTLYEPSSNDIKGGSTNASAAAETNGRANSAQGEGSSSRSYTGSWGLVSDDLIEQFVERYNEFESYVVEELEDRKNAAPVHVGLGEEVEATENLAVSVISVEPGPYDYADNGPTVKVVVTMRNLTDKIIAVKASNWDACNSSGQFTDHKLFIKDEHRKRDVRSFYPTRVSPHATFTGTVYFDGESLESVVYERHWLLSSQNQYIYFDL